MPNALGVLVAGLLAVLISFLVCGCGPVADEPLSWWSSQLGAGLIAFTLLYAPGVITASWLIANSTFRRPQPTYILAIGGLFVASFLGALGLSHWMWGYFLERPALPALAGEITHVRSVTMVETPDREPRLLSSRVSQEFAPDQLTPRDDYYFLEGRVLRSLKNRGLLPNRPTPTTLDLKEVNSVLAASGPLAAPETGYHNSDLLAGVVVDGETESGSRLVFLALRGGEVSNDHYPFYEVVLGAPSGGGALGYEFGQRFFYDVAGMEGMEWPVFFSLLSVVLVAFGTSFLVGFDRCRSVIRKGRLSAPVNA